MVEPPLWKIWKSVESVGMIIPNLWKNRTCSKPPTSYGFKLFKTSCWPIEIATLGYPMCFGQIQIFWGIHQVVSEAGVMNRSWFAPRSLPIPYPNHSCCQNHHLGRLISPAACIWRMFIPWIWKYPHCCLLKSLKKQGQTRVQTTCINMSWLTAITIYIQKNGQSICG